LAKVDPQAVIAGKAFDADTFIDPLVSAVRALCHQLIEPHEPRVSS
jgi:hypothetical protein